MRQRRLLIVGCGDVLKRALPWLSNRFTVYALVRSKIAADQLRTLGLRPIIGDLDHPKSLQRLSGLAEWVIHSAPPPASGTDDPRTKNLLAALSRGRILPRGLVYISTSGVYGDCAGEWIDETRPPKPESARAQRRLAAEMRLRRFGNGTCRVSILRAPGIYANDRLPLDRILAGTPALSDAGDTYTNHIHAADLARACGLALFRANPNRVYNICDNASWKMGEWFDRVADAYQAPRPPRMSRDAIREHVSPALWSFMRESRRLKNERMLRELRLRLLHPTPEGVLSEIKKEASTAP
jgi:nucleoside-diphosphate-sugar epimerase